MMLKFRALFPAVVSVFLLTACPGPPIDPYPPYEEAYNYLGTWTGTLNDSVGGAGEVTFNIITQSDDYSRILGGSWRADFGGAANDGVLRSQPTYDTLLTAFLISSRTPDCVYNVEATRTESTLRGTYLSSGCTPYVTGTLELTKQP